LECPGNDHAYWSRQVEIDVATFDEEPDGATAESGGVATWAPPQLLQTALLSVLPADVFAVLVFTDDEGPQLVGAVALVSPSNKDRQPAPIRGEVRQLPVSGNRSGCRRYRDESDQ
jgi:hypothetical protein